MNKKGVETQKQKYGQDHFKQIGRKGAQTFWSKYYIKPAGTSRFAIFRRSDDTFVNWFAGPADSVSTPQPGSEIEIPF